jgi:hypothetical protein
MDPEVKPGIGLVRAFVTSEEGKLIREQDLPVEKQGGGE